MDEEDRERYIAHQHVSHFSDNKVLNNEINGMTVDIGTDIDWTERTFSEDRDILDEGEECSIITEECSHKFLHGNKENCPFRGKKCASSYWQKIQM